MLGDPTPGDPFGDIGTELVKELAHKVVDALGLFETSQILRSKIASEASMPPSRETAMALTKLDECEMWMTASIKAGRNTASA